MVPKRDSSILIGSTHPFTTSEEPLTKIFLWIAGSLIVLAPSRFRDQVAGTHSARQSILAIKFVLYKPTNLDYFLYAYPERQRPGSVDAGIAARCRSSREWHPSRFGEGSYSMRGMDPSVRSGSTRCAHVHPNMRVQKPPGVCEYRQELKRIVKRT